jgi:putative ABC transport system permease protein
MGDDMYGVKWRNFKLVLVTQRYLTDPVATFGVVGGIGLGVFLGWALVEAAGNTPGSVISQFVLPTTRLAIVVVVGAIAGVLAGLRPARRAARLDVLRAIATE